MDTSLSMPERLPPTLYPFFGARLCAPYSKCNPDQSEMSIVFLQGGGLSKDQIDRSPTFERGSIPRVLKWLTAILSLRRG